jgi:hypothetical protein
VLVGAFLAVSLAWGNLEGLGLLPR